MHPDYQADIAAFEAIKDDAGLIEFIDRRIVTALPEGWVVSTPDDADQSARGSLQDFGWTLIPFESGAWYMPISGEDPHYHANPINRYRLAFVYGDTDAGPLTAMNHCAQAVLIHIPYLTPVLKHIFERPEVFPLNEYGLT